MDKQLQKNNAENYFVISYALTYADILQRYLMDCGVPKEFAHHLANEAALRLGDWIEANCIKKCDYECIRRSNSKWLLYPLFLYDSGSSMSEKIMKFLLREYN